MRYRTDLAKIDRLLLWRADMPDHTPKGLMCGE
jgi:hypothetical protein